MYKRQVQGQKTNVPKKPAPDGVYAIMERLDVSPEETIYVGDSWVDIETGRAAGNFAVGVLWGFRDEEEPVSYTHLQKIRRSFWIRSCSVPESSWMC